MGDTSIEWTSGPNGEPGYTFNPWLGCSKVHTGCTNCYAEVSQAVSMRKGGRINWGEVWQGGQRVIVSDSTWANPFRWAREAAGAGQRRKVFCASLADVLEVPEAPREWPRGWSARQGQEAKDRINTTGTALLKARERLWDTIRETAHWCEHCTPDGRGCADGGYNNSGLDWLLLTKRPENWRLVPEDVRPLVWLGTSISNQETAEQMVPHLLKSSGFRYRFLSVEPMVGPVDLWPFFSVTDKNGEPSGPRCNPDGSAEIAWVVFGFESGSKARPGHVDWIREGLRQCQEAGVAAFVKQLGAQPRDLGSLILNDHKGRDPKEWPEELRVREWPNAHGGAER